MQDRSVAGLVERGPRRLAVLAAILAALASPSACRAPGPLDPESTHRSAIIDGEPAADLDGVVALLDDDVGWWRPRCSAVVIAPYAVLTAQHCIRDWDPREGYLPVDLTGLVVGVGSEGTPSAVVATAGIARALTPPGALLYDTAERDLAVLLLDARMPTAIHEVAETEPAHGERLTVVGFGWNRPHTTSDGTDGVKHSGSVEVAGVYGDVLLVSGHNTACHGDSGGPALDASMRVAGLASQAGHPDCTSHLAYYTRPGEHLDLVAEALLWEPPCPSRRELCDGEVDDDCDGEVDEGCSALGEACNFTADCAVGTCELDQGESQTLCALACDPGEGGTPCPEGFDCVAEGAEGARCLPEIPEIFAGCASAGVQRRGRAGLSWLPALRRAPSM